MIKKIWSFLIRNKIPIIVALAPIIINYLLFTWRAPGVVGKLSDWFTFLGSYLGLIGAVYIALFQMKVQKQNEIQREVINNRSYVLLQEFGATLMLVGANTHENSRIIKTKGFEHLLRSTHKEHYKSTKVGYIKISHHGGSEVIYNCEVTIKFNYEHEGQIKNEDMNFNIGAIEKGTEVFIPLFPYGYKRGKIETKYVSFEYSTLVGERLYLVMDFVSKKERLESLSINSEPEKIYEIEMKETGWVFPNKIDHSKL